MYEAVISCFSLVCYLVDDSILRYLGLDLLVVVHKFIVPHKSPKEKRFCLRGRIYMHRTWLILVKCCMQPFCVRERSYKLELPAPLHQNAFCAQNRCVAKVPRLFSFYVDEQIFA